MLQVQSFVFGFQIMKVPGAPFIDKKFYPHTRYPPLSLFLFLVAGGGVHSRPSHIDEPSLDLID